MGRWTVGTAVTRDCGSVVAPRRAPGPVAAAGSPAQGGAFRVAAVPGDGPIRMPARGSTGVEPAPAAGRVQTDFSGLRAARAQAAGTPDGAPEPRAGQVSVTTMSGQVISLEVDAGPDPEDDAP